MTEFHKTRQFIEYSLNYLKRHNLFEEVMVQAVAILKDMLSCRKKLKIAKYRVNYQMYKSSLLLILFPKQGLQLKLKC